MPKLAFPSVFAKVNALGFKLGEGGNGLVLAISVGSQRFGFTEPEPFCDVCISNPFSVESRVLITVSFTEAVYGATELTPPSELPAIGV